MLVPFMILIVKNGEKCFDIVYVSVLILYISVRLTGLNFYFYDTFFNYKKMVKKGYTGMKVFFYYEIV